MKTKTPAGTAAGLCRIHKNILKKGLAVPIGDKHASPSYDLQYRWLREDESNAQFQVFYLGEWQDAESIDFDFD